MRITWDEPKRLSNIAKHGLDFADLTPEFFLAAHIEPSRDGRALAIGRLGETLVIAVVSRQLGSEAISIISMRPASPKERDRANGC